MAGLNLQGGYGAGGGFDAMLELREAVRRELQDKAVQQEAAARLEENARQFNQTQPLNIGRLKVAERHAAVDEGRAAEDARQFNVMSPSELALRVAQTENLTQGTGQRKVTFDQGQIDRQALLDRISGMPEGPLKGVVDLRRLGVNIGRSDMLTPTQRGAEAGQEAIAAEDAGAGEVYRRRQKAQADYAEPRQFAPRYMWTDQGLVQVVGGPGGPTTTPVQQGGGPGGGTTGGGGQVQPQDIAEVRGRRNTAQAARVVIDSISELSQKINTGRGLAARIQGPIERAKAEANLNDDLSEYQGLVAMNAPLIARAMGRVGVMTEQDEARIVAGIPRPEDSQSVAQRKVARLYKIMDAIAAGQSANDVERDDAGGGQKLGPDEKMHPNGVNVLKKRADGKWDVVR